MASTFETPSKITDYFPPSPKPEVIIKEECEEITETTTTDHVKPDSSKDVADLSNSSVVLTPKSSPVGKDINVTKDEPSKTSHVPVCKKALSEQLNGEVTPEPSKGKKKRRKKKKDTTTKTELTNGVVANQPARPKSSRPKKTENDTTKNTLVTDYFPVRRSDRRCKVDLEKEKETQLQEKILGGCEDGLTVEDIPNKGRGVLASKPFLRGDFVVQYVGDLIDMDEAKHRDDKYSKDTTKGCYMYYFNFKNKKYCIDATEESGKLGRLLNHSKANGNCHTKLVSVHDRPYLILAASRDIATGEELQYDYGDRSKASIDSHPWLKC